MSAGNMGKPRRLTVMKKTKGSHEVCYRDCSSLLERVSYEGGCLRASSGTNRFKILPLIIPECCRSTLSSTNSREDELRQKVVRLLKPTHVLDLGTIHSSKTNQALAFPTKILVFEVRTTFQFHFLPSQSGGHAERDRGHHH